MADRFSNPGPQDSPFAGYIAERVSPTQILVARRHLAAGASLAQAAAAAGVHMSRDLDVALWQNITNHQGPYGP